MPRTHHARHEATEDALTLYLGEMRAAAEAHPLLTRDEERALIARIQAGMVAPGVMDPTLPTNADARRALDAFMCANLRLVLPYALRAVQRARKLEVLDFVQAGNLGMLRAIGTFDLTRRYRFSTYATNWIKQAIGRERENNDRTIRLPVHTQNGDTRYTVRDAEGRVVLPPDALSLDRTTPCHGNDLGASIAYTVAASGDVAEDVSEAVTRDDEATRLRAVMAAILTPSEARVLSLRFGLESPDGRDGGATLDEVGRALGVTRERARQIEAKALTKLRQAMTRDEDGALVVNARRVKRAQAQQRQNASRARQRERERAQAEAEAGQAEQQPPTKKKQPGKRVA